jgi:hypothetical protein
MDGRKNNGGHSTKAKGADKRKNQYREAVERAATEEDVVDVIKMLLNKAKSKQDVKAAQLFLEYTVGKPKQDVEIEGGVSFNFIDLLNNLNGSK